MSTRTPSSHGWFAGRTRLITVASVIGVAVAGAAAASANLGILDSAAGSPVGNISASADLAPAPTQVVDVYLPEQTPTTTVPTVGADPSIQEFAVDVAGSVSVAGTGTGVRLESVSPAPGWTWTLTQSVQEELLVVLTDGIRTFEFRAALGSDGSLVATVDEPVYAAPPASPSPAPTAGGGDDDDHDEHEAEEYEGGEDDD